MGDIIFLQSKQTELGLNLSLCSQYLESLRINQIFSLLCIFHCYLLGWRQALQESFNKIKSQEKKKGEKSSSSI